MLAEVSVFCVKRKTRQSHDVQKISDFVVSDGTITIQKAAETAGMDEATFRKKMSEL